MRFAILFVSLALLTGCSPAPEPTPGPFGAALDEAARTGRRVVVEYFDADLEGCALMEKETYPDPEVIEAMAGVVHLRMTRGVDADAFEERWPDAFPPSLVVLEPDGTPDGRQIGKRVGTPLAAGDFLFFLDWVTGGIEEEPDFTPEPANCCGCGMNE